MDKNIFIEKVTALFLSHGPRTLTMDDIAREFSISKKTLYQMYSNKEEILKEVMIYSLQTIFKVIRENSKKYDNPLAFFLLSADETLDDLFVDKRDAFFNQMIKVDILSIILDSLLLTILPILLVFSFKKIFKKSSDQLIKKVGQGLPLINMLLISMARFLL